MWRPRLGSAGSLVRGLGGFLGGVRGLVCCARGPSCSRRGFLLWSGFVFLCMDWGFLLVGLRTLCGTFRGSFGIRRSSLWCL